MIPKIWRAFRKPEGPSFIERPLGRVDDRTVHFNLNKYFINDNYKSPVYKYCCQMCSWESSFMWPDEINGRYPIHRIMEQLAEHGQKH